MPEFLWLSCLFHQSGLLLRAKSKFSPSSRLNLKNSAVRPKSNRKNAALGQESAWKDLPWFSSIYSPAIWGGARSSESHRRPNLLWLQGIPKEETGSSVGTTGILLDAVSFMLWYKRASVFLLYLHMGPAPGGRDRKLLSYLWNFSCSQQGLGDSRGSITHILTQSFRCFFEGLMQKPCESI